MGGGLKVCHEKNSCELRRTHSFSALLELPIKHINLTDPIKMIKWSITFINFQMQSLKSKVFLKTIEKITILLTF